MSTRLYKVKKAIKTATGPNKDTSKSGVFQKYRTILIVIIISCSIFGGYKYFKNKNSMDLPQISSLNQGQPSLTSTAVENTTDEGLFKKYFDEANDLLNSGKLNEAVDKYLLALSINKNDEDTHFNLGIAYSRLGKLEEAKTQYLEAIKIMPDYAEAYNNLGNVFLRQNNLQEALNCFSNAIKLLPENASAHNNLGTTLARTGKIKEAIAQFEEAIRLMPTYMEAHFNLASALTELGQIDRAKASLAKVLELSPGFEPALKLLNKLQSTNSNSKVPNSNTNTN